MRHVVISFVVGFVLAIGLVAPADAARPVDPQVSRLVGTVHWVTDSYPPHTSWYMFDVTIYAKNVKPNDTMCVKVTWPGQDRIAESGYAFPRVTRGGETSVLLPFGAIPDGAAFVDVTAQLMRLGSRDCCIPVGAERAVSAALPSPRPAVGSSPVVVFDETYPTP
jgi:hypothetical protein